ncbi:MAG TPA: NAD(P)-binding domain-containing protein [Roseiarcus sp.]|nr:NAD(P)-binding domain-containing protein [Roseiarcus sp.]
MKVGIIGSGVVGQTLAAGFLKHGHQVEIGTRDPAKLKDWSAKTPGAAVKSFAEAAAFGDVVVLAVGGEVAQQALTLIGSSALQGKTVIDACNPIGGGPPVNGVLSFFTPQNQSLMEQLQGAYPSARFVKAFNSVGSGQMVNPEFASGRPTMFICGNDKYAKKTVERILEQFGWDTEDMGAIEAARPIEALCMLWCIPGIGKNDWSPHAFKLLR